MRFYRRFVGISVVALIAAMVPVSPAVAAPKITFLNPSGYSTSLTISDEPDKDEAVHLVAWVQEVPANPLVEFEVVPPAGPSITIDSQRVGTDTWEAFVSLSALTDGPYSLKATLYANFTGPGTGTEVATTQRDVTVNHQALPPPPPADTVEISYPNNGAAVGFFTPAAKPAATLLDVSVSEGTSQVRALYTVSPAGSEPAWVQCGTKKISTSLTVSVRCTLAEGDSGARVTAVAAVANNTPTASDASPVADATGDAHRVLPYVQKPTRVSVTPESVRAETSACQLLTARVDDQFLRPIVTANIDVHVVGPNDQVQFGTIPRDTTGSNQPTSGFQAPEKAHVSQSDGIHCNSKERAGKQGDHNIPGANDPQHIESTGGTDDEGKFYFAIYSASTGSSVVTAWVDEDDDDVLDGSESTAGARIGWGQDAPTAQTELFFDPRASAATSGDCVRVLLAVKRGGSALPNANVDIHASGPDSTVAFCTPSDGSAARFPDQGHIGDADDEDTRHLEGESNSSGQFVFGVTSASSGLTELVGWLDATDDDLQSSDETTANATIQWDISGDRTISIDSGRRKVRKGRNVRIFGSIDGASACEAMQTVKLKKKRLRGGRFRTLASTVTDESGAYTFRVRVKASKRYKAVAPAADVCSAARSKVITIRAT